MRNRNGLLGKFDHRIEIEVTVLRETQEERDMQYDK